MNMDIVYLKRIGSMEDSETAMAKAMVRVFLMISSSWRLSMQSLKVVHCLVQLAQLSLEIMVHMVDQGVVEEIMGMVAIK